MSNVFDNLTPADFVRETSAVRALPNIVINGFDMFVEIFLEQCRLWAAKEDDFIPFAVLGNRNLLRYFHGEDDEVPGDFASRLHREAQNMDAAWLFTAMVAPARAVYKDDAPPKVIDDNDLRQIQSALHDGDLDLCVCWTSASKDGAARAGIMYLDDEGDIGQEIEAPLNPATNPFTEVLA